MFASLTSSASVIFLSDDMINRLGLDPTQELGLAESFDPNNPLNVLLALPPAHYMERRSCGGNNNDRGSFSMYVHFTKSSGVLLGANIMRGRDVVFDMENGRVGFAESDCDFDRETEEKEERE